MRRRGALLLRNDFALSLLLFLEQTLNGLQLGVTLFLMAAGLTLVFGIMNMVNLAHGSLYMVGAFFAATFTQWTGSFAFGLPEINPQGVGQRYLGLQYIIVGTYGVVQDYVLVSLKMVSTVDDSTIAAMDFALPRTKVVNDMLATYTRNM